MWYTLNSSNWYVALMLHDHMLAPAKAVHIECARLRWVMPSDKLSTDVFFDGFSAVEQGHNVGPCVPHYNIVPPTPANILLAIHIPFSSCKMPWPKRSVLVNGTPAAAFDWKPLFMRLLNCGDPVDSLSGFVVDAPFRNTVRMTPTDSDIWAGVWFTAFEIGKSMLWGKVFGSMFKKVGSTIGRRIWGKATGDAAAQKMGALINRNWVGKLCSGKLGRLLGQAGMGLKNVDKPVIEATVQKAFEKSVSETALKWGVKEPVEKAALEPAFRALTGAPPPAAAPHADIINAAPMVE